jgi:hypothetical protein
MVSRNLPEDLRRKLEGLPPELAEVVHLKAGSPSFRSC